MIVACGFDHAGVPLRDRLLKELATEGHGGRVIGAALAAEITAAFLSAVIRDEERHVRRRAKVDAIERTGGQRDS